MVLLMAQMKEKHLEQWKDLCLVHLTEMLKETSSACLTDDLMAIQTVLMTETHWVLQTV